MASFTDIWVAVSAGRAPSRPLYLSPGYILHAPSSSFPWDSIAQKYEILTPPPPPAPPPAPMPTCGSLTAMASCRRLAGMSHSGDVLWSRSAVCSEWTWATCAPCGSSSGEKHPSASWKHVCVPGCMCMYICVYKHTCVGGAHTAWHIFQFCVHQRAAAGLANASHFPPEARPSGKKAQQVGAERSSAQLTPALASRQRRLFLPKPQWQPLDCGSHIAQVSTCQKYL